MKKILLLTSFITASCLYAQEEAPEISGQDYNKWSIEVAGGLHKPVDPFAEGHWTDDAPSFGQFSVGTRYMMNNRFGMKLDFGMNMLKEGESKDQGMSPAFKTRYYRADLQGVANLGAIFNFSSWTNTIGLLMHAGIGYSEMHVKEPIEKDATDHMLNVIYGFTPQIKLGSRLAFNIDVSMIHNVRQHHTWDGTANSGTAERAFNGKVLNVSAGLTLYLGKHDIHADWVPDSFGLDAAAGDLEARVAKIETDLIDSDQDGVPDYLDREPNTPSGVAVDSKGYAVDLNNNGIPDELESTLDQRYSRKGEAVTISGGEIVKKLIDEGYVNVYFQFDSTRPETYSLEAINYLIKYMAEHPSAKAELVGYADELGNADYNQTLSANRAQAVYNILIATGVSPDRLTHRGAGVNSSVDKDSAPARQLVRCVTFRLQD